MKLRELIEKLQTIEALAPEDYFVLVEFDGPESCVYLDVPKVRDVSSSFPCLDPGTVFNAVVLSLED
ncbi:hypothetical protein LCGC14_0994270 [marine sediment metagenome]|uniref:Uncharacterized protein n=1 Tax=marine sediment metagenome TaxID=412755 RepID=A0A0F9QNC9_9ZZZZ